MRALFLMLMISANCFPWGCIVQRILRVHFHQCFLDSPQVPKPHPILALDEILYSLSEISRCSYIAWTRPSISKYAATSTISSKSSSSTSREVCPPILGLCWLSETPFVSIDRTVCRSRRLSHMALEMVRSICMQCTFYLIHQHLHTNTTLSKHWSAPFRMRWVKNLPIFTKKFGMYLDGRSQIFRTDTSHLINPFKIGHSKLFASSVTTTGCMSGSVYCLPKPQDCRLSYSIVYYFMHGVFIPFVLACCVWVTFITHTTKPSFPLGKKNAAIFIPESNVRQGQKTPLPCQPKLKLFFLLHRTDDSSVILNT